MEKSNQKEEDNLCYVCHKNLINIRVMPCRHAYLCRRCSMKMASGKCKICHDFYLFVKGIIPGEPLNYDSDENEDEKKNEKSEKADKKIRCSE